MTTLLVIDDSASVRRVTAQLLTTTGLADRVVEAGDGLSGLRAMIAERPALVLCDLEMPLCDGARFLALVRSRPELAEVPVVMLTGEPDPERKAVLFEAGAADYVTKPFHPRELVARVQTQLRLRRLHEELLATNRHLAELSRTDALTGLRNRRALDQALELEVTRAVRYELPLSLVMIDLDHFKRVNDEHGHLAGDRVLAGVGRAIGGIVRTSDVAARYGGEELAVLLPHTGRQGATAFGERVRRAIAAARFEGTVATVTASLGVADLRDLSERSVAALIASADGAVYAAKAAGRNVLRAAMPRSTDPLAADDAGEAVPRSSGPAASGRITRSGHPGQTRPAEGR